VNADDVDADTDSDEDADAKGIEWMVSSLYEYDRDVCHSDTRYCVLDHARTCTCTNKTDGRTGQAEGTPFQISSSMLKIAECSVRSEGDNGQRR
jgi:hypothetical protein